MVGYRRPVRIIAQEYDAVATRAFHRQFGHLYEVTDEPGAVSIVLVGERTWRSKSVDRAIVDAMRPLAHHEERRSSYGLMAILLRAYRLPDELTRSLDDEVRATTPPRRRFVPNNLPPRLWEASSRGLVAIHPLPRHDEELTSWLDGAAIRRAAVPAKPSRIAPMLRDRRSSMPYWRGLVAT